MKNAFIIHGAYGNPEENWIPWLKNELEHLDFSVNVPKFPTPENQSLENWQSVFTKHLHTINPQSILIGHSIGVSFLLHLLEKIEPTVASTFLISPFCSQLGNPNFDNINTTFLEYAFDWERIKTHSNYFAVFHGDNDPYVPMEKAKEVTDSLHVPLHVVQNAGHFNTTAGYSTFNLLLSDIKKRM